MCKKCTSDWKQSGLNKRDFQHSKDGPEEITRHPKRKSKGKRWCKGKEGREHRYEKVIWYTYRRRDLDGNEILEHRYRWACKGCGKVSWSAPQSVPQHEHCFCVTKIAEIGWRRREEIYEECCVCGKRGKSYSFYKQ